MSERGSGGGGTGFGPFLLGLAVGAVAGLLFAPGPGEATRATLSKRLRGLKELADEKLEELTEGGAEAEPEALPSAREELERRLADARRRRRTGGGKATRAAVEDDAEEDEPVA